MKNLLFALSLVAFLPFTAFSQADTYHDSYSDVVQFAYPDNWVVTVKFKEIINEVLKVKQNGATEIRYTYNFSSLWEFNNTVTGERKIGPDSRHATGVFYPQGANGYTDDYHWVQTYVNDPVFGGYHIVVDILLTYDPNVGFFVIQEVKNTWIRNP